MKEIKCTTQAELEACCSSGNIALVFGGEFTAHGSSTVTAYDSSTVTAYDSSTVTACDSSTVTACDSSTVRACDSSTVTAYDSSTVTACDSSTVTACGSSTVTAYDSSTVRAYDSSTVRAFANVFVRLFSAISIKASASVVIIAHGNKDVVNGGNVLDAGKPKNANEWCEHYGVSVKQGKAILYKSVCDDFSTYHARKKNIFYKPGNIPSAPDWDGGESECGGGLHFSPLPFMALQFNNGKHFIACPVKISDIVVHPDGDYPEKVKAEKCCAQVYEVDIDGNKI